MINHDDIKTDEDLRAYFCREVIEGDIINVDLGGRIHYNGVTSSIVSPDFCEFYTDKGFFISTTERRTVTLVKHREELYGESFDFSYLISKREDNEKNEM